MTGASSVNKFFRPSPALPYLHPFHRLARKVREHIRRRNLQRLGDPHEDGQAGHFQAELQVADVVAGEIGGFGERFLGQAACFSELAKTVTEKFRFLHACIPYCGWNNVFQPALECAFSAKLPSIATQRSL